LKHSLQNKLFIFQKCENLAMQMSELMVACGYTCTAFMNSSVPVTKHSTWVFLSAALLYSHSFFSFAVFF